MNKIKYRVWDNNRKTYLNSIDIMDCVKLESILGSNILGLHYNDSVMELSSGMFSKEGDEICEGDILNTPYGILLVKFGEFDNGERFSDNESGNGFYIEARSMFSFIKSDAEASSIIGNIHENPELLINQN